jgi:hypothetical protein
MTKKKVQANPKKGTSRAALLARQREERAVQMRLEGHTLEEIAAELGYANRCGAWLALVRAKARLAPIKDAEELRQQEIARTFEIEQEAFEQWERSTEDAETTTTTEDDKGQSTTLKREGQSGNPALLDKVLKAMERRAKLLGLDKPQQIDMTSGPRVIGQTPEEIFEAAAKKLKQRQANVTGD